MSQRESHARTVFMDTSAHYALVDANDRNHPAAVAILARIAREGRAIITTNFVVAETHALLIARLGRDIAADFLDAIAASSAAVIRVVEWDEQRAHEIIRAYADKDFSYTDASSFAVMERLGIAASFAFDRHFVQFGLATIQP